MYHTKHTCSFNDKIEFSKHSSGGGSMNGNLRGSGKPIAIICKSDESSGTLCSSGVEYFSNDV